MAEGGSWSSHIIVCGLNDVGLRVVEQLHAAGERVLVVDDHADPRLVRIVDSMGVTHRAGDARRTSTLREAGVQWASALLCVEADDLHNLGIALLARELRTDLRVIVSLSNAAVGRAVGRLTGPGTVLDVAELSAPAFIEACLLRTERLLSLGGSEFVVAEREVQAGGDLRRIFGDLAPLAVAAAGGGELVICPGRDHPVEPGDRVTVVGPASDFADLRDESRSVGHGDDTPLLRKQIGKAWRLTCSFIAETEDSMRLTVTILFGVAVLSVVLLMVGYSGPGGQHMSVVDAAYFTTETLTTVGFGDFVFAHQDVWLRIWAIALMIIGATLVTILYALLTNLLVSRRLAATAGARHASRLRQHIVLVGLGSVGLRVLEGLRAEGRDVVVIERDDDNRFLGIARERGIPVIIGDSTVPQTLLSANLASAAAVAVLTSNDLINIETGLAVDDLLGDRRVDVPVVLRVFDRQLAQTLERSFDFRHVRSTSALAAPWFVGAALGLDVLGTFYIDQQPFLVGRLTVAIDGGLTGRTMQHLSARIRVIAISRARAGGRLEHPPRRDTRFEAGDVAYLVGPYEELLRVLRH